MEFSDKIKVFLETNFPGVDIYKMSLEELEDFKKRVTQKRQEYSLLELAMKTSGNAAYGACASPYFFFFNPWLAGDITGECRELTQTMWKNLNEFFRETIWERKDLWEKFGFELDESKREWAKTIDWAIYSDTDSEIFSTLLVTKDEHNNVKEITIGDLFDKFLKRNGLKTIDKTGHEIVECCDQILNYIDNKIQFTPIKHVIRHKVSKSQFKIRTKSGKEIIVTGDHSVIVFRDGKQMAIEAKNINVNTDLVLVVKNKNYDYELEDIESVEQLEDFDNEYVYDIEVDDPTHTFIANDILIHNSVYTTFGPLFHCMTEESQKKFETDEQKIEFILKFNKDFLDIQNNEWCEQMYGPRFGKNVHEFELETISKSQIVIKKKKYLKGLVYNKGKILKTPKVSGTGIEIIKSTTPKLCREILSDLMRSLMFDFDENHKEEFILEFNEKLKEYKKQFYNAPYEDISQSVGIGDYKKFVINDDEMLEFEKRVPPSVHAIARFNYLAKKNGEKQKCLYSGKIKYYNVRIGQQRKNPTMGFFGFPAGELPDWRPEMDKLVQWEKTVINPINRFLEVMNIPLASAYDQVQMSLFDWSDFQ